MINPLAVTGVSLNMATANIAVGDIETLVATVEPENATVKTVIWSSDDPDVATVDSAGKVTGVASGNATITVTTVDGDFTDTCEVTVE